MLTINGWKLPHKNLHLHYLHLHRLELLSTLNSDVRKQHWCHVQKLWRFINLVKLILGATFRGAIVRGAIFLAAIVRAQLSGGQLSCSHEIVTFYLHLQLWSWEVVVLFAKMQSNLSSTLVMEEIMIPYINVKI